MAKILSNATAEKPSSKPGSKAPEAAKPKKEKVVRQFHPALAAQPAVKDGKPVTNKKGQPVIRPTKKLDAVPTDFDPKLHKPLGKADFADESLFYELKAVQLDKQAAALRSKAADIKALGSVKDRQAAKKLLSLQKRMKELVESLKASGVDTSVVDAMVKKQLEAAQSAPAAQSA